MVRQLFLLVLGSLSCLVVAGDLRADLRDFIALVPRRRIGYIAARYYIFDPRFRRAYEFLRSDEFPKVWNEIRAVPKFADVEDYLANYGSGFNVGNLVDKLSNRLRSYAFSRLVPVELMLRRDLTTFLQEVIQSLPRAQIYSLISRKMRDREDFAKFYRALLDKEFKKLVDTARNSSDLKAPLHKLAYNGIDVDEIIRLLFELIKWGPRPT